MKTTPLSLPLGPVMLDVGGLVLTDDDKKRLTHPLTGAVILFARNYQSPDQVTQLISEIKALRSPSLLVAVDQEGGRVQRFKDGFSALPPAADFGVAWDKNKHSAPIQAFQSAVTMASELLAVGVDFSFAPVFDLNSVDNEVIGNRCFHPQPQQATELLGAYIDGMHAAGMVAIAKHFPGHGGVGGDSHHCLPEDRRSIDDIATHDLVPYKLLVDEIQGVMSAHVHFSDCDDHIPTLSAYWLQQVLRQELGFTGVVFSDDLSMQGAQEVAKQSIAELAEAAIAAGCDMVLVCNRSDLADQLLSDLNYQPNESLSGRLSALAAREH